MIELAHLPPRQVVPPGPVLLRPGPQPHGGGRRLLWLVPALACLVFLVASDGTPVTLFVADFGGRGLISNEYATRHPGAADAVISPQWLVTSGSLFADHGVATNGALDRVAPNATSSNGTDSSVFRAYTREEFAPGCSVRFDLRVARPHVAAGMTARDWDGMHLIVLAQNPAAAYYVSLYRRDGQVVIKKKSAGGPVAGGSYQSLSRPAVGAVVPGRWTAVRVDVRRSLTGAVTIDLYENGGLVTTATDDIQVSGSRPYVRGTLGLRADNTTFAVRSFVVDPL